MDTKQILILIKKDYLNKIYEIVSNFPENQKGVFVSFNGSLYGKPVINVGVIEDATINNMPKFKNCDAGIYQIIQIEDKICAVVSGYGLMVDEIIPIEEFSASVLVKIYNKINKQIEK